MNKSIVLKPRLSEKVYALSELHNTYVFDVPKDATKHTIATAVSSQYEVTVKSIRVATIPGKVKQSYKKRSRAITGKRSDIKKAYVTLKVGDKLPIFDAVEEPPKENK